MQAYDVHTALLEVTFDCFHFIQVRDVIPQSKQFGRSNFEQLNVIQGKNLGYSVICIIAFKLYY